MGSNPLRATAQPTRALSQLAARCARPRTRRGCLSQRCRHPRRRTRLTSRLGPTAQYLIGPGTPEADPSRNVG